MKAALSGTLNGRTYSAISSLHFSAETKGDELILKNILEYYDRLSCQAEPDDSAAERWVGLDEFDGGGFYEIRMVIDSPLTDAEISRASGCLGYALREVLAGEDLSEPEATLYTSRVDLTYYYDSTKSRRDDPDYIAAFDRAIQYIQEGTPVRKTNRAGAGTKGTRLVEGIGPRKLAFYLR